MRYISYSLKYVSTVISQKTLTTFHLLPLFLFVFLPPALSQNQKDKKKERYEQAFGDREKEVRTLHQAIGFAEHAFRNVEELHFDSRKKGTFPDSRFYIHDRLRSLIKGYDNYEKNPEAIEVLINIQHRKLMAQEFTYARNQRLIELLRRKSQLTQDASERMELVHQIIGAHRTAAQHALKNKNWKRAISEYNQVVNISDNVSGINQSTTAKTMIGLIKKRKRFKPETANLINQAYTNPEDETVHRAVAERLARQERWQEALTFLHQVAETDTSDPFVKMVQMAVSDQVQPYSQPERIGRFLFQLDTVRKQLQNKELIRTALDLGFDVHSRLGDRRERLTTDQKEQISSLMENWKETYQKIGLDPSSALSDGAPKNPFYPKDGLLLYIPANGDVRDYSGHNRHGVLLRGSRLNLAAGILGAIEFTGASGNWVNAVTIDKVPPGTYDRSFTVAFFFKRMKTGDRSGGMMFRIGSEHRTRVLVGTTGKKMKILLWTRGDRDWLTVEAGLKNNTWYHFALTYKGTRRKTAQVFLNGRLIKTWTTPNDNLRHDYGLIAFGNKLHRSAPFVGLMDDLFLYDRALKPDEIQELYKRPK